MNNNMRKGKIAVGAVLGVLLIGGTVGFNRARSERLLDSLTQRVGEAWEPPPTLQQEAALLRARRRFRVIWAARDERDVSDELAPFLQGPPSKLRLRAMRAVAQLETPSAEAALQSLLQQETAKAQAARQPVSLAIQKMMVARARTRDLKGGARVAAVARSAGLSLDQVAQLSERVQARRHELAGSMGNGIVEEMVELLYTMADKGENIQSLANRLSLNPAQQVKLQAAPLPGDEEIGALLNYLSHLGGMTGDDEELVRSLVDLYPSSGEAIIQRLEDMKAHPDDYKGLEPYPGRPGAYRERLGYVSLFRAARQTGDARAIPLLKHFERDANREVAYYAVQTREFMERDQQLLAGN